MAKQLISFNSNKFWSLQGRSREFYKLPEESASELWRTVGKDSPWVCAWHVVLRPWKYCREQSQALTIIPLHSALFKWKYLNYSSKSGRSGASVSRPTVAPSLATSAPANGIVTAKLQNWTNITSSLHHMLFERIIKRNMSHYPEPFLSHLEKLAA